MSTLAAVTVHGFDLRSVAESHFPLTDFSDYLRFMAECRKKLPTGTTHKHHVLPQAVWPEFADEPENLILLSTEDHARAHELLNRLDVGELYTPPAFIAQAVIHDREFYVEAGRKGGLVTKEKGVGLHAPGMAALGGRIQGRRNKEQSLGLCGLTLEQRCAAGRVGSAITNHERWHVKRGRVNPQCELCRKSALEKKSLAKLNE
jgi:general stress protein YciG